MIRTRPGIPHVGAVCLIALLGACKAAMTGRTVQSAGDPIRSWAISPELSVAELAPGVWLHTSWITYSSGARFPSNGLIIREGESLLLIDTAWGEVVTQELLGWIGRELRKPIRRAIITHAHHDRIGGAAALQRRGIPMLAHSRTRELALAQGYPWPDAIPGLAKPGSAIHMGAVEVFYPGPGHAPDNLMVWLPGLGILFGGCAVRSAAASTVGNLAHADPAQWREALRRTAARYGHATLVVPGHGDAGGIDLLEHTRELLSR